MIPVETLDCNFTYHLAGAPGEGELPCHRNLNAGTVRSYWRPSDDDRLTEGQAIYFHVHGVISPVKIGLVNAGGEGEMEIVPLLGWDGGGVASVSFDSEVIAHFLDGGYVAVEVDRIPPYPLAVWIDKLPPPE